MRPGLITAGGAAMAVIAACAGSPMKTKVPDGLTFACDNAAAASIVFNDGGYLPDSNALGRDREGTLSQRPRSAATLTLAGTPHPMVAEWAELGLRYRALAAGPDGRHLILTLRGEEAVLGWRAELPPVDADPAGEPIATCRRAGRDATPASPHNAPQGDGDDHHP